MFKSVEYAGFEKNPDAKIKVEQLTTVMAGVMRRWWENVEIRWSPDPIDPANSLNLALTLTLPNGVSDTVVGRFSPKDFAEEWLVQSRCRRAWSDVLGRVIQKQQKRIEEALSEPVEV